MSNLTVRSGADIILMSDWKKCRVSRVSVLVTWETHVMGAQDDELVSCEPIILYEEPRASIIDSGHDWVENEGEREQAVWSLGAANPLRSR